MLSIFVAQSRNGVIGKENDMPWHLPGDLPRFKRLTTGHTVIMGRKTLESIVARLGRPLPNRRNIVLTRDPSSQAAGVETVHSVDEALALIDKNQETFVIGGAQVYKLFLPYCQRIYLTQIEADIDGDTYFPSLGAEWQEVNREDKPKDEHNRYDFSWRILEKR